jgi:hypothetical protein
MGERGNLSFLLYLECVAWVECSLYGKHDVTVHGTVLWGICRG